MSATAASIHATGTRSAVFDALDRRNRLVAVLRIGLPALGAIILAGLVLQLYVGSLVPDFRFANVSIDRNNLVIEKPVYAGTGSDGSVYSMTAQTAKVAIANPDLINLTGAAISLTQPGGTTFSAHAQQAQLQVSEQVVTVDGDTRVVTSSGLTGTIGDARVDVFAETLVATGGVRLAFDEGSTVEAEAMSYSGAGRVWRFTRATVTFDSTPGEAQYLATTPEAGQ